MRLATPVKLALGAASILPLASVAGHAAMAMWQAPVPGVVDPVSGVDVSVWGLLLMLLVGSVALVFRLPSVEPEKRSAWVVFLLLFSVFAVPAFWYAHIYKSPSTSARGSDL